MKTTLVLLTILACAPFIAAETWDNVALVDGMCATKARANSDAHPRSCALQCAKAGYGILTTNGDYLKFDSAGNAQAAKLLNSTDKTDHLRVDVSGQREGDHIKVDSISFR